MISQSVKKIFRTNEIHSEDDFYLFSEKFKIVVFVPENFTELLADSMSKAGAGVIGKYEMCSFRSEGTGTFLPLRSARPFSGSKNKLSYEKEIRLEMECGKECLNKVINVVLKNHPYEEAVYEIYSFLKRESSPSGKIVQLKSAVKFGDLSKRLNKRLLPENGLNEKEFKKIIVLNSGAGKDIADSVKFAEGDCVINKSKNNFKLYIY